MSDTSKNPSDSQATDPQVDAANPKRSLASRDPGAEAGPPSNTVKDPGNWTTGDETMTGAQASYLQTLSEEAGEPFDPSLSKAAASRRIDALQAKTGRGKNH